MKYSQKGEIAKGFARLSALVDLQESGQHNQNPDICNNYSHSISMHIFLICNFGFSNTTSLQSLLFSFFRPLTNSFYPSFLNSLGQLSLLSFLFPPCLFVAVTVTDLAKFQASKPAITEPWNERANKQKTGIEEQ